MGEAAKSHCKALEAGRPLIWAINAIRPLPRALTAEPPGSEETFHEGELMALRVTRINLNVYVVSSQHRFAHQEKLC